MAQTNDAVSPCPKCSECHGTGRNVIAGYVCACPVGDAIRHPAGDDEEDLDPSALEDDHFERFGAMPRFRRAS